MGERESISRIKSPHQIFRKFDCCSLNQSLLELHLFHLTDQFLLPMVFVKMFMRISRRSAVATSSAPVPGDCSRFFAVMCLTPVPGVSCAFISTEFQDPVDSHFFSHRGCSFVSRHSTYSTATCSSAFSPLIVISRTYGASEAVNNAEFLDLVHTHLLKHLAAHSGPCVRFLLVSRLCFRISLGILVVTPCSSLFRVFDRIICRVRSFSSVSVAMLKLCDHIMVLSPSFPSFVEFITPPGEILVADEMFGEHLLPWLNLQRALMFRHGSLPRPPEYSSVRMLLQLLFGFDDSGALYVPDVELWRDLKGGSHRKGELHLAFMPNLMEFCAIDFSASLHSVYQLCEVVLMFISLHWLVFDASLVSSRDFPSQGELWTSSTDSLAILSHENDDSCLAIFSGLFCVELLSSPLALNWIKRLLLLHHCYARSFVVTQVCVTSTSPSQNRDYGCTGHLIVARSHCFDVVLQFLYGSQPRPPDILFSLFHFSSICQVSFMSKMKVPLLTFILRGSIRV